MKHTEVFFRVDGSDQIGLGHLVRCMALAEMIRFDFNISFVSILIPDKTADVIKQLGFTQLTINNEESFLSYLKGDEIVILDHYFLGSGYQKIIKEKGCKLVCIDDLHQIHFYADVIINHAPGVKSNQYDAESYTSFCLGLDYALLRKEFREQSNKNRKIESIDKVLICFGGADPHNFTCKVLQIIKEIGMFKSIDIIVGNSYNFTDQLSQFCSTNLNINFFSNLKADEIVEIMHNNELAIVPASSIAIECLSAKQVLLTGITDDNQKDLHDGLVKFNTVKTIGSFRDLKPEMLISQLKTIKEQANVFTFSNIGEVENSIINIFKYLNHDKNW